MSAHWPYRCTTTTAFVRGVNAASSRCGSRLYVRGSMSTNTGVAPLFAIVPALAKKEYALVITSSPGPTPSAQSESSSASVPEAQPIACAHCE